MNALELQHFMRSKARLALDDGYVFGPGGEGFQRFNLACPRIILQQALERLEQAVKSKFRGNIRDEIPYWHEKGIKSRSS